MDQTYQMQDAAGAMALFAGALLIVFFIVLVFYVVGCLGLMRMFQKAGKPGWAAFVPVYNVYIIIQMIRRPMWWFYIYVGYIAITFLNSWASSQELAGAAILSIATYAVGLAVLVLTAIACNDLAKAFGRGIGTTIGLFFLPWIFSLILGFGSAHYEGGQTKSSGPWGAGVGRPDPAFAGAAGAFGAPATSAPSPYAAAGFTSDLSPARQASGDDWARAGGSPAGEPRRASSGVSSSGHGTPASAQRPFAAPVAPPSTPSWPPIDDASRPAFTMAPPAVPVAPLGSRIPGQPSTA